MSHKKDVRIKLDNFFTVLCHYNGSIKFYSKYCVELRKESYIVPFPQSYDQCLKYSKVMMHGLKQFNTLLLGTPPSLPLLIVA